MEYILFIHKNVDIETSSEQWNEFFIAAKESGVFLGGSEISNQIQIGNKPIKKITDSIDGFMRFESEDINIILELLKKHPIIIQGGSLELCEMPKSEIE
jgi:hypothetical protein